MFPEGEPSADASGHVVVLIRIVFVSLHIVSVYQRFNSLFQISRLKKKNETPLIIVALNLQTFTNKGYMHEVCNYNYRNIYTQIDIYMKIIYNYTHIYKMNKTFYFKDKVNIIS